MLKISKKQSHKWTLALIIISIVLAGLLLIMSACALIFAPSPIDANSAPLWNSIKDIGPAVAGFWVVAAAIFTITAAGITVLAEKKSEDKATEFRKEVIRKACVNEILAFWDRMNNPEIIEDGLEHHIDDLRRQKERQVEQRPNLFRRYFGDDWFLLSRIDPLAISELEDFGAEYISLSARARNLVSRFNWLNGQNNKDQTREFWINYHHDTLVVLREIAIYSDRFLMNISDKEYDSLDFSFSKK